MSSENAAFCKTDKAVNKIAETLNKGDGDGAQRLLNECFQARVTADPAQHKAWTEMHDPSKTPDEKWAAVDRDFKAAEKVGNDLWKSVIKAQDTAGGAKLCKLELTTTDGATTPAINKSETCNKTEIQLKF